MLADRVYEQVLDDGALELAIARILGALRIAYISGISSHPRLPVRERTLRELAGLPARTQERLSLQPQALYNVLVMEIDRGSQFYGRQDYERAAISFERAAVNLQAMLVDASSYYLAIAQVVCDVHLARYDSANERLEQLANHHDVDESWHAARGIVCLAQNQRDAAVRHFRAALDECRRRGTSELEVRAQLCQLDRKAEWELSLDGAQVSPYEMTTLRYIRAKRSLDLDRPRDAVVELRAVSPDLLDEDGMLLLSEALFRDGRLDESIAVLSRPHPGVAVGDRRLRMLARCLVSAGMGRRAAAIYQKLLGTNPAGREGVWMEYARVLRLMERRAEATALCEQLVGSVAGMPTSAEAVYCIGFAYFILGKRDVAAVFETMARDYGARPYAEVLQDDLEWMRS